MATIDELIVRIEADVRDLNRGLRSAERASDRSGRRMSRSFAGLGRVLNGIGRSVFSLRGALAGLGVAAAGREAIRAADTYRLLQSRLSLVTDSTADLIQVEQRLFAVSQNTRVSFEETANLYARLARSSDQLGVTQDQLLTVTQAINEAIIVSGATSQEASAGLIQFSQGLASGALRGDELRSVLEQLPRLALAIANGLGITVGQLRELGAEGQLSARAVLNALLQEAPKISTEFGKINRTAGQALTQLGNALLRTVGRTNETAGATDELVESIDSLRKVVESPEFATSLLGIAEGIITIGEVAARAIVNIGDLASALESVLLIGRGPSEPLDFELGTSTTEIEDRIETINERLAVLKQRMADLGDDQPEFIVVPTEREINALLAERIRLLAELVAIRRQSSGQVSQQVTSTPAVGPLPDDGRNEDLDKLLKGLGEENELLQLQLSLIGRSNSEIEMQIALLRIRQELGDEAASQANDLLTHNAALTAEIERQQRAIDERIEKEREAAEAAKAVADAQIVLTDVTDELGVSAEGVQGAFSQLGFVASSAFEDAIIEGKGLSEVLGGLEQDILRIITRLLILDPIAEGLSVGLGGLGLGGGVGLSGVIADLFPSPVEGLGAGTFQTLSRQAEADIAANPLIFGSGGGGSASVEALGEAAEVATSGIEAAAGAAGVLEGGALAAGNAAGVNMVTGVAEAAVGATAMSTAETAAAAALAELTLAATTAAAALSTVAAGGAGGELASIAAADIAANPLIFHSGGVVGGVGRSRTVSANAFRGAPRMHDGGIAGLRVNEVPAILERGERVLPRGGGGDGINVSIMIGSEAQARDLGASVGQVRGAVIEALEIGRRRNA